MGSSAVLLQPKKNVGQSVAPLKASVGAPSIEKTAKNSRVNSGASEPSQRVQPAKNGCSISPRESSEAKRPAMPSGQLVANATSCIRCIQLLNFDSRLPLELRLNLLHAFGIPALGGAASDLVDELASHNPLGPEAVYIVHQYFAVVPPVPIVPGNDAICVH